MKFGSLWLSVVFGAMLLSVSDSVSAAPAVPDKPTQSQNTDIIVVTRVSDVPGIWDVTLPKGQAHDLIDQAWLVVDGHRESIGGDDFYPEDADKPLKLYANISDELDGEVKDILKAQGLPLKPKVTLYRITYSVNFPSLYSSSRALNFRHSSYALLYTPLPATASYKVGDKIRLFDAVAVDTSVSVNKIYDLKDPSHQTYIRLPNDQLHRLRIEVEFKHLTERPKVGVK